MKRIIGELVGLLRRLGIVGEEPEPCVRCGKKSYDGCDIGPCPVAEDAARQAWQGMR